MTESITITFKLSGVFGFGCLPLSHLNKINVSVKKEKKPVHINSIESNTRHFQDHAALL